MQRRSEAVSGYVNFPIKKYKNTGEGGTFIRLVVYEPENSSNSLENSHIDNKSEIEKEKNEFRKCCGGLQSFLLDESFIRCDNKTEDLEFHFPQYEVNKTAYLDGKVPYSEWLTSRGYLCIMTIGTTGWTGWNDEEDCNWYCTFEDLTDEGKQLYLLIKKLYPNCNISLQTFLDT